MNHKVISFRETLTAATRLIPGLWTADGELNTTAVARYCKEKGHPVSQPTLHRHFYGTQKARRVDDKTAKALSAVFHIRAGIWKGEPLTEDEEKALSQFDFRHILIAQKLEGLPERVRNNILNQIEDAHEASEKLKRAGDGGSSTPPDRSRNK